ncbi:MAG TPA: FadR/GntR family transcriptional regulator [Geminicoccus sp.]|jgi:DNA-binding FadR family transcriptional regulator|uniref:FadR/GntR family transcriptional regulator n=1 Tax=Geminicoccus sp. TaxID=2024832 RepID=UPI002E36B6C3|nr:FadR/GntR family transcriptional regulator [Geminicoccus sp.]HEX2527862.1 FadR/GntR family transcriptional regulator [Geminicoccus sp.]
MSGLPALVAPVAVAWLRLYPRTGLHGRLVHQLGERIGRGELAPGEALPPIDDMLELFGVSRTSIREAMRVLAAKGLIELRQRTGGRIRPMADWNLLDPDVLAWIDPFRLEPGLMAELVEVRLAIEPQAARTAALRGTEQDVNLITGCLTTMEVSALDPDLAAFYAADLAFHASIFDASHNRFLTQLGRALMPALDRAFDLHRHHVLRRADSTHLRWRICPMHAAILEAIRAHDPVAAEQAMRRVIENAISELAYFEQRGPNPWDDGEAAQVPGSEGAALEVHPGE